MTYTGADGQNKKACACTSNWAVYGSFNDTTEYSSIAFHRFPSDDTIKFPSKTCYYKEDYSDTSPIPVQATCNVKESARFASTGLTTQDCFASSRDDVSIAFGIM